MNKLLWMFCCLALASPAAHAQKLTWSRLWGSTNFNTAKDIARGRDGYFYVAGSTIGNFDGQTNNGASDAFLSKFDTNGVRLWTRIWGSSSDDEAAGVVVDRQTNVYVCGQTAGSFDGETNSGALDMFITKWTSDGTPLWTRIWGSTSNDDAAGIVCDSVNDVYVGGTTKGTFGTPGQTNAKVGFDDFCLTKYSSSGSFQWSRIWGCTNNDTCYDIAKDPNGEYLYLAGTTRNGIFDGQTNYSPVYNITRLALTAYNTDGTRWWSRVWGATNKNNVATCVAAGSWVYVAGYTAGSFDDQTNVAYMFNTDYFVSQFEFDTGVRKWTRIHGTNAVEEVRSIAQDSYANVYLGGQALDDLDGQTRVGGADLLLVKYDPSGNRLWTRLWGGPTDDGQILGIALDGTNGIYACGDTDESFGGQTNPSPTWGSAVLTRWRQGPNVIPSASIQKPITGREFLVNETVLCAGRGNDTDDGALTNLQWRFGTNSTISYGMTATVSAAWSGSQTVTAYAIDTEFATGKASVVVTVLADGGNGLPQLWETNYWPTGNSGGDTNDFDGDGVNNRSEWESGTDPTNPLSTFKFGNAQVVPGTPRITIQWPSVSNRDYSISSSSNLPMGFSSLASVPPTPPLNTYTTPASADPQIYYRVEVIR
jgi:hypothetical protein